MNPERQRRHSYTQDVLAYFQQRPGIWIGFRELMPIGGAAAWRTRVSEARKLAAAEVDGGRIEHRDVRDEQGRIIGSEYRYVPYAPLGRDASQYTTQPALW